MKRTVCAVIASYPVAHTISSASTAPSLSSTSQLYRTVNMSHRQPTEYNSNEVSDDVTHDTVQSLKSDQTERKSIFLTPHPIGPVSCSISGYIAVSNQCTLSLYKTISAFSRQNRKRKKKSISESSSSLAAVWNNLCVMFLPILMDGDGVHRIILIFLGCSCHCYHFDCHFSC